MSAHQESQRAGSARHYLIQGPLTSRLETTLALVAKSMGFPQVRVNILDEHRQHSISLFGADNAGTTSRAEAFCDAVVRSGNPLRVEDATADARFKHFPAVIRGEIGAYLGVPLLGREALIVGAVCVIDPDRRPLNDEQQDRLVDFGKVIEDQLDLIRRLRELRLEGAFAIAELTRAVRDGEIVPWYQPVIDLTTGETVAFEALARWEHPDGTVDDPRQFVPAAEDSELIVELDLAVLRRALADLSRWQRTNPALRMGVNLSARHFSHDDCAVTILAAAAEAGVTPGSIDLEVTETMRPTERYADIAQVVNQLREVGFEVWLDDFGTGWSALDHLLWLRVDGIKIDRAVTVALGTPIGDALVLAVTGLARALGLRITIEGIENPASAQLAREMGCDYAQGYLWAAALPAPDIDLNTNTNAGLFTTPHAGSARSGPSGP